MTSPTDPTRTISSCPSCGNPLPADVLVRHLTHGDAACPSCGDIRLPDAAETVALEDSETVLPEGRDTQSLDAVTAYTGPKRIAGYRILRELGSGGMGTVFEAFEEKMNRKVALKILARHMTHSEKAAYRFDREAWIGGKLNHPNLVKVFEKGDWEDFTFYSMELVRGGSLADVVKNMKRWGRDNQWNLEFGSREYVHWAISKVITAARGLDYAHREGVVHRDIKPMNLLLSRQQGTVMIADFGLAVDMEATRMTTTGKALGTLIYMAPEQILGKHKEIDGRTDIFALGVTLFELLTLELPYKGKTQQLYLNSVLTQDARRPSKLNERVSRDLEIVIRKTLEKEPRNRYPTAGAFADDLENVLQFRPITARPPKFPEKIVKWARRKPIHAALAGALLIGIPTVSILGHRAVQHRQLVRQIRIDDLWSEIRRLDQRREYQHIVDRASEILAIDPDHIQALRYRGLSYMHLARSVKEVEKADDLRNRALADISGLVERLPRTAWPHREYGSVLRTFGREEKALVEFQLAEEYRPENPSEEDLFFDGLFASDSGDFSGAVDLFSEVIARRSDWVDPITYRGDAYEALEDLDRAIFDYRLAAALDPDNYLHFHNLGRLHTQDGSFDEGESYLRQALEKEPDNPYIFEALAENHIEAGKWAAGRGEAVEAMKYFKNAEEEARKSLDIRPGLSWAHLNLGVSLMEQNRLLERPDLEKFAEATNHYDEVLLRLGGQPGEDSEWAYATALLNKCDALIQIENLGRALKSCTEVAERFPDDPLNHYNLAGVYGLMNRTDEAFLELEKDFELGDTDFKWLSSDPWFENLHEDPRFTSLIQRMTEASKEASSEP